MNSKFKSKLTRKMFFRFFGTTLIFTIILAVIFFIVYIFGKSILWSGDELLYDFLLFISKKIFQVYSTIWIIGIIIIFLYYWNKTLNFIDELVIASSNLLNKDINWISLPEELNEVERQMNQIKQESIKNAELAKVNEQKKNDLIVYLAHDIKTPLTSVIGYLSLLSETDLPKKQRIKYQNIALDKSYKLEGLINEFFDITRFNSEIITTNFEEINLNFLLEQLIDEFYPLLIDNKKKLMFNSNEIIMIYGDSDKLGRAFNNLIKNAVSYSYPETTINISLYKKENAICVEIENKGKKIPENKISKIFDKFYRGDISRTTSTGGSGLGLAIAKEIIEIHRGKISVSSTEEKTVFKIILPIKENNN